MKHLRLAKVATLEGANAFLEKEYWPEWNAHFARPVAGVSQPSSSADAATGSGRDSLSRGGARHRQRLHVFLRRPPVSDPRAEVQAGMRRQRLRVELRLDGELKARYQGRYVEIGECGARPIATEPKAEPSRFARITTRAARATGWMASSIAPVRRLWKCLGG